VDRVELAETALVGWRGLVANGLAEPLAARSSMSQDQVRAILGAGFFAVSLYYVVATLVRALKRA